MNFTIYQASKKYSLKSRNFGHNDKPCTIKQSNIQQKPKIMMPQKIVNVELLNERGSHCYSQILHIFFYFIFNRSDAM